MKKEYIIVLEKGVNKVRFDEILKSNGIILHTNNYDSLDRHYKVSFDPWRKAEIKACKGIVHVCEADAPVTLMANQQINVDQNGFGDNWGLTRICRRDEWSDYDTWFPNTGVYEYSRTGTGVDAYVVDTGARLTHDDFKGRISVVYDHYNPIGSPAYGVDTAGHGTHVASTVAGTKYGVAKDAHIYVSRVFENGGATLSAIIAGINACLAHHNGKKDARTDRASVMNLSLGGPAHTIEEQAINDCIDAGIVCVAAAGNDGKDLEEAGYDVMPAEIARAITVGSSDIQDYISSFSNYGKMVDVFAPGHYITAAGFDGDDRENMLSGTSMAAPHVAGVCALYLQGFGITHNAENVKEVHDWIANNSTKNTVHLNEAVSASGTVNKLLYSEFVTEAGAPAPVTEVSRRDEAATSETVERADAMVDTTFADATEVTDNGDSITTRIVRTYTDTSTVMITTTTMTIVTTIITYSDGSEERIVGDAEVNTVLSDEVTVTTRTETIEEETVDKAPAPTPEPAPEPEPAPAPEPTPDPQPEPKPTKGRRKGWWKKEGRAWVKRRNTSAHIRVLKQLERIYNKVPQNDAIEDKLAALETIAEELTKLRGHTRVQKFAEFLTLKSEITSLIFKSRHNK